MRAAVVERYGGPEAVRVRDVRPPEPDKGDVLVQVRAAAVTSGDARIRGALSPHAALALGTGSLGAFTRYSTFSWEVLTLVRDARWGAASPYLAGSIVLAFLAAALGYRIGSAVRP